MTKAQSTIVEQAVRLGSLAAGLCQDSGIGLEVSPHTWAWDPMRRVILVAADDLQQRGPDYCAGVIAHEVGHYFISRYLLFSLPFLLPSALSNFLNAIEDPRSNTWIKSRYPGTAKWLGEVGRADALTPPMDPLLDFLQFCLECAREELRGWQPTRHPLIEPFADDLEYTRPMRRAYAELLPGPNLDPSTFGPDLARRYRLEVWPMLPPRAAAVLPSAWEQGVRVLTLEALRLAERELLPVARRILEGDVQRIATYLAGDRRRQNEAWESLNSTDRQRLAALLQAARQSVAPLAPRETPVMLKNLALRLVDMWLQRLSGGGGNGLPTGVRGPVIETDSGPPRRRGLVIPLPPGVRLPLPTLPAPTTSYDQSHQKVANQITHLARQMEDVLRPRRRLGEKSGFPSGYKLDLRRVLRFSADPRTYNQLWIRKSIPDRRSTAVLLLADLSGSMRGEKSDALLAGTVLLAETLHRLDVPFAVTGFQDVLIPFCDFPDGLTSRARQHIGQMPREINGDRPAGNNRPSYNDDGPCLLEAAEDLLAWSAVDRLLIVVSDGLPEGRRSSEEDLRAAVRKLRTRRDGLKLIGIGLGPETEHVKDFYPESIANVPVSRLAAEIGGLLRRTLLGP